MEKIVCNKCGKCLKKEHGVILEDFLYIKKTWGYFSKKDGVCHNFILCEECYDKIVQGFAIPPQEVDVTELI